MSLVLYTIGPDEAGQRIDNFLRSRLKGLPKSRLYRAVRKGEVRVNQKRVKPDQKLQLGDKVRIPPLRISAPNTDKITASWVKELPDHIIFEDKNLMVLDKPPGVPVHGGTSLNGGIIEALRQLRPQQKFLELIHRLDRETSGCLLIAKKRATLLHWHRLLTEREAIKDYMCLVKGRWTQGVYRVDAPLLKNTLKSGERIVRVHAEGKSALTEFRPLLFFPNATLMSVRLFTGRTHQIRVHAAHTGHPIAGDEKYGDRAFNKEMRQIGLKRLFLHAASICSKNTKNLSSEEDFLGICVILAEDLTLFLKALGR